MKIIGFTGTQEGMTEAQKKAFVRFMLATITLDHKVEFHHGNCIGADAEAHDLVREHFPHVVIYTYPSFIARKCANKVGDFTCAPAPPLLRNQGIVSAASILVAAPKGFEEELRSGTWTTVRYARKKNIPVVKLWPSGCMETEKQR